LAALVPPRLGPWQWGTSSQGSEY